MSHTILDTLVVFSKLPAYYFLARLLTNKYMKEKELKKKLVKRLLELDDKLIYVQGELVDVRTGIDYLVRVLESSNKSHN